MLVSADNMDPGKAGFMPMQIRNNATDLQDYLKGLEDWEADVKEKDAALSSHKSILKENLPPIRGSSRKKEAKKKKTKPVKIGSQMQNQPRIKSYDFKAWDNFDVDQACEEVDYQVESTSSSEGEEDEQETQRKQQAVYEKEKGNELFKEGHYELAVECYSKAADLDPLNPVMPANRAMALLKLERYGSVESDCSLALTLDGSYLKAFLRRGTARLKLGKPDEAREDFQSALKLEPGNKLARAELDKLNKEREKKFVHPVKRPPHLRSKKPLKRITVEDIGEDTSDQSPPTSHQSTTPPDSTPHTAATPSSSLNTSQAQSSQSDQNTPQTNKTEQSKLTNSPTINTEALDTPSPATKIQVLSSEPDPVTSSHEPSSKMKVVTTEEPQQSGPTESRAEVVGVVKLPPVPENSITLQADWKRVRRDRKILGEYFKSLPTSQYPSLLQQSLETDIFSDIITILLEDYVRCGRVCLSELQALTRVKRFSVALMFLSSSDKQNLKLLFSDLRQLISGDKEVELFSTLSSKYGI